MSDLSCFYDPACNGVHELAMLPSVVGGCIDVGLCADKTLLLQEIGMALGFPAYYGNNWDALEECLNDMGWREGPILLCLTGVAQVAESDMATLREIFMEAARAWQVKGRACSLILTP